MVLYFIFLIRLATYFIVMLPSPPRPPASEAAFGYILLFSIFPLLFLSIPSAFLSFIVDSLTS